MIDHDREGSPLRVVGVNRDLRDGKPVDKRNRKLEQRVAERTAALEFANREFDAFSDSGVPLSRRAVACGWSSRPSISLGVSIRP
jgi:hypothetical protein